MTINAQQVIDTLADSISQAPAEDLDALITLRGLLSQRIGELENPEGVEVVCEAEGTVGEVLVEE